MEPKKITFTNEYLGQTRTVPTGFSWTTLFFGFFPAIFRGDWKLASIQILLVFFTRGLTWIIMPCIYNKLYMRYLFKKGFIPNDENHCKYLVAKGIVSIKEMRTFIDISKAMSN